MVSRNFSLFRMLRNANRYCCNGQSAFPRGSSCRVFPKLRQGRTARRHPLTSKEGSSQITASAFGRAKFRRLGPPSIIHASVATTCESLVSISYLDRCFQSLMSFIASKDTKGISGRALCNKAAMWLLPDPFAPVTINLRKLNPPHNYHHLISILKKSPNSVKSVQSIFGIRSFQKLRKWYYGTTVLYTVLKPVSTEPAIKTARSILKGRLLAEKFFT